MRRRVRFAIKMVSYLRFRMVPVTLIENDTFVSHLSLFVLLENYEYIREVVLTNHGDIRPVVALLLLPGIGNVFKHLSTAMT